MAPKEKTKDKRKVSRLSQRTRKKPVTQSIKAGLIFSVGRCASAFRRGRYSDRFGKGAAIFMAAVLEYISCEILELAGNLTEEHKK